MAEGRSDESFALEVDDLARKLDTELLDTERAQNPAQRAAHTTTALKTTHTLKGLAAVVGQPAIARTCHLLEGLLKQVQSAPPGAAATLLSLSLEAGSALCAAAQVLREGKADADEVLLPVLERLEGHGRLTAQAPPAASVAQRPLPAPTLAPAVRITDHALDNILGHSEELYYAAAVLRMRQDQLETLCEDFASMLAKYQRRADADRFGPWTTLLNRFENVKAALQRSTRTLQKVSVGLEGQLRGLRLVSIGSACRAFEHVVRDTAMSLGKEVEFNIEDSGTELDRSIIESLREPLLHLIRNAIGHGIESPRERQAVGKPPRGQLRIIAKTKGSWAEITVEDDGRGIDTAQVRRRAAELHLAEPGDNAAAVGLLFHGGISTAASVTELSGRGLGLAIVRDRIEQLHGHVAVDSTPGEGSRFVITVPLTLTRMRLLLLVKGANVFGVPSTSVRRLVRATEEQVLAGVLDDGPNVPGTPTKLGFLAHALGMREERSSSGQRREAFVLGDGMSQAAFLVDALVREDEALVKSLGPRLKSAGAYLGGTFLPDGRVALVLNPAYLMEAAARYPHPDQEGTPPQEQASPAHRQRVLLVEDSDVLRALGKRILEQAGCEVHVAADGQEGFELWKKLGTDVVVTDVEMPVMDGLALARAIRHAAGPQVKIVLVSASDTAESRAAATQAGADAYLIKGSSLKKQLIEAVNERF